MASRSRRQQRGGGGSSSSRTIGGHGKAADNSAAFHSVHSQQFLQRYPVLLEALGAPVQHVALLNSFTTVNDCDEMGMVRCWQSGSHLALLRFPDPLASHPPPPLCPYSQLRQFYYLDAASLLPPLLLGVQPHHVVLDMCAAPGGKSLILAQQLLKGSSATEQQQQQQQGGNGLSEGLLQQLSLQGASGSGPEQQQEEREEEAVRSSCNGSQGGSSQQSQPGTAAAAAAAGLAANSSPIGRLVCNELDQGRRGRLQQVLNDHIPASLRRRVRVTGHDAAHHWSRFEGSLYDRVLLDAPCSGERHVVQQAMAADGRVAASSWSLERCQQLAAQQIKMLLAGLRALKPGGRLAYSTCSLAAAENDLVVEAALAAVNKPSAQQQPRQQNNDPQAAGERAADRDGSATDDSAVGVRVVPVPEWSWDAELQQLLHGEATRCGLIVLPDRAGWGPVYVALLEK